jgi:hypothetical protein
MGISISGPSTQIPTNVVEIGNEISQNAINAISASLTPSTGNPFSTSSELSSGLGLKANLASPSFTGSITTPQIDNPLNTNLVVHTYNDVGAGTHYYHTFAAFDGTYVLPPNGGGLVFPDGSTQTTATVQGIQGPQGPQGPQGDAGGSFSDVGYDSIPYIRYNQTWQPLSNYDQSGGGISDAPNDSQAYVRFNSTWQLFSSYDQNSGGGGGGGIGEAPYNGNPYIRINGDWQPLSSYDQNSGIGDAPYDNNAYIRINNAWQLLSSYDQTGGGGGGGIGDAPADGTSYVRVNSSWSQTFRDLQSNSSGDPFYPYEVKITVNGTDYWMPCRPV